MLPAAAAPAGLASGCAFGSSAAAAFCFALACSSSLLEREERERLVQNTTLHGTATFSYGGGGGGAASASTVKLINACESPASFFATILYKPESAAVAFYQQSAHCSRRRNAARSYQNLQYENVVVVCLFGLGDLVLVGGVFQIGFLLAPGDLRLGLALAAALDFDRLLFGVLARLRFLEGGRDFIRLLEIRLVA